VYLLRYPVTMWMHAVVEQLPPAFVRAGELLTPVVLVAFSIAVFRFWEEPARKTLRKWFTRERPRSVWGAVDRLVRPSIGQLRNSNTPGS
jgi:peptidoglycan/LPS O-acetylase OafA/YrhL